MLTKALSHENVLGNGGIVLHFNLGIIWRLSGQLHAATALSPGEEPRNPLNRKQDGPQSRSGCCEEKNLAPAGNRTPAVACRHAD